MRMSEVKKNMKESGRLDDRALLSYATLTGKVLDSDFQNLVAAVFSKDTLDLYRANMGGSVEDLLVSVAYKDMENLQIRHRFLYSFTAFTSPQGNFRFYNYDKKVFLQGFRDAGIANV